MPPAASDNGRYRADAKQYIRFELRWSPTDPTQGTEELPVRGAFSCVRGAVELGEGAEPHRELTIGDVKNAIFERLKEIAAAQSSTLGHALSPAVERTLASLSDRVTSAGDLMVLAPVASRDNGDIAASPLFDHQLVAHVVPPPCRVSFPFEVTRFDDVWMDTDVKPPALTTTSTAVTSVASPLEGTPHVDEDDATTTTAVVSSAGTRAPYANLQARVDAALDSNPQVRAMSFALMLRLRRDVEPMLSFDPLVLARVLGTSPSSPLAARDARGSSNDSAAPDTDEADADDVDDPAELVRRNIAALQDAKVRGAFDDGPTGASSPSWGGKYGRPAWFRLAPLPGPAFVESHPRTAREDAASKRQTHLKTEFIFRRQANNASTPAANATDKVLLAALEDVPRPSQHTASTVERLHAYLQPYAEMVADASRLLPVETVVCKPKVAIVKVEYLDADFDTFVLATPSTVSHVPDRLTRALRVAVSLSTRTYKTLLGEHAARRRELRDDGVSPSAGASSAPPEVAPDSAANPAPPPSQEEASSTSTPPAGDPQVGQRADEAPLLPSQSLLAQMSTRTRADTLAALALTLKQKEQDELESGARDDDVGFLAHVVAAGLVNLVSGGTPAEALGDT